VTIAAELAPFVVLGLVGSLHCAGMCGGFAIAASLDAPSRRTFVARQLVHQLGKASTYGVIAGLVAHAGAAPGAGAGDAVAWLAGAGLVALGLRRLFPRTVGGRSWSALERPLRRLAREARALPGLTGRFAVGVANGLLPCGLSAGAFLLAADRTPTVALCGGLLFGLATAPLLVLTAAAAHAGPRIATRLGALAPLGPRLLGVTLIVFGVLTWSRVLGRPPGSLEPCHDPGVHGVVTSAP